jgi:hypothetical protein
MDDRRTHHRYPIWFPVTVERRDGKPVWSICRDASAGGVMISAVAPLDVAETVTLSFRLDLKEPERRIDARVIRTIDNDDELLLAFPFRLALEFIDRDDTLPAALQRRAERGSNPEL